VSALTKLFIVLLVVCDLLLCGAVAVFVNRVDDYKKDSDTQKQKALVIEAQRSDLQKEYTAAKSRNDSLQNQNDGWTRDYNKLRTDSATAKRDADTQIADMKKQLAVADQQKLAEQEKAKASEMRAMLVEQRETDHMKRIADLDHSNADYARENAALALKNDVLTRDKRSADEQIADLRMQNLAQAEVLENNHLKIGDATKAPVSLDLRGVITSVSENGGQYFAYISLGANDRVEKGMRFNVNTPGPTPSFLAEFVVDRLDPQQAFGIVTGPRAQEVKQNCPVHSK
jgi:hypothetical protein